MRVRCSATADYRSNAVGEIELECTARGLCIALCGVSRYREGYAPGPPVHANDVCVPWPGVYATRLGERQLQLSIDARNLPLNRFLLSEFAERPPESEAGLTGSERALPWGLAAAGLVALGLCLALVRALPHARAVGTLGWAAAVVAVALGVIAWRARTTPRPPSHVVLDELCYELARYVPHHISAAAPTPTPPSRSFEPVALSTLLPRSAVAIAITLAAATLAALVGVSAALLRPEQTEAGARAATATPAPRVAPLPLAGSELGTPAHPAEAIPSSPAPTAAATTPTTAAPGQDPALGAGCTCARHESLAWQTPLPRLSPVIVSERSRWHEGHQHTELELALVNDGDHDARQLELSVVFFEARAGDQPGQWQTGERPLFFEGPLAPGHAIHWHVEGRGTSFDVIAPDFGTLAADASDAAPPDAVAALANAGARAIRLHATQLLAFSGDRRAESARRALGPLTPAEADYLDRLLEPTAALVACDLHVEREPNRWRVEACAFNRSAEPALQVGVRLLAFDAPIDRLRPGVRAPALLAEDAARLPTALPAQSGRRFELSTSLATEAGRVPRAFELQLARAEALP